MGGSLRPSRGDREAAGSLIGARGSRLSAIPLKPAAAAPNHSVDPSRVQSNHLHRLLQEAAVHLQAGRLDAAARLCAQARTAAPRDFHALNLSGALALRQARFAEAADWLARALQLKPRAPGCALRLGFALAKLGRHAEAESALRAAVSTKPDDAEAWDTLGYVLKALGRLDDGIVAHRQSVALQPNRALSWYNLGQALLFAGRAAEALACQERAVAVEPSPALAHYGRALALQQCHRIPEAIAAYDETLARDPGHQAARSYRLMALNYLEEFSRPALFAEHVAYGTAIGAAPRQAWSNRPDPSRRLRVAFLSPDLRAHSVAYFLEPLLANLDPARFEIVLYHDHFVVDAVSERLRGHAAIWRNFVGLPADGVEAAIRADAPDVLIDLAGHTGLNRLALFARRLAPVQISYLGYPNTTGLRAMDYRFVDALTDPVGETEPFHTERLVRFAATAWAYQPPAEALDSTSPARTEGTPVTFGCFNNFAKVTDTALVAWSRLLAAVPGSRLRLKSGGLGDAAIAKQVRDRLVRAGLDLARVDLIERTAGMAEHLALYRDVDVALDTFPYHGTTTTCEALWMGVPVVTLEGDRHASRVGTSLLTAAGHPEWVASDWDGYVKLAATLAGDPARLAAQRASLRTDLRDGPLLAHAAQATRFGAAVHECWAEWCATAAVAA